MFIRGMVTSHWGIHRSGVSHSKQFCLPGGGAGWKLDGTSSVLANFDLLGRGNEVFLVNNRCRFSFTDKLPPEQERSPSVNKIRRSSFTACLLH